MILVDNLGLCDFTLTFWRIWQKRFKIKYITEDELQILLNYLLHLQIKLISLKRNLKYWWQFLKSDKLSSILLAKIISLVLVLSIKTLLLNILFDTFLDG